MKIRVLTGLVLSLACSIGSAQNLRPCTDQKLTCKLEDITDFYHRKLLDETTTSYSGRNDDEPSIQPDSCRMSTALSNKKKQSYVVSFNDKDLIAGIYVTGSKDAADVSFKVTPGSKFYYRSNANQEMLTCELSVASPAPVAPAKPNKPRAEYLKCLAESLAMTNASRYSDVSIDDVEKLLAQPNPGASYEMGIALKACAN